MSTLRVPETHFCRNLHLFCEGCYGESLHGNRFLRAVAGGSVYITCYSAGSRSLHGPPVTLTVNVYRSLGQVQWNGANYNNGNLISAYAGCTYTVTGVNFVQESTQGHNFQAWLSNAGSFANPNYYTTTFTPSASGKLVLVLYGYPINTGAPGTYPDWGGYVVSGSSVYMVYGTITIPTTISWVQVSTWKPDNLVSLWVGLGGWTPSGNGYT